MNRCLFQQVTPQTVSSPGNWPQRRQTLSKSPAEDENLENVCEVPWGELVEKQTNKQLLEILLTFEPMTSSLFMFVFTYWSSIWSCSHQTVSESISEAPAHLIQLSFTENTHTIHNKISVYCFPIEELLNFYPRFNCLVMKVEPVTVFQSYNLCQKDRFLRKQLCFRLKIWFFCVEVCLSQLTAESCD